MYSNVEPGIDVPLPTDSIFRPSIHDKALAELAVQFVEVDPNDNSFSSSARLLRHFASSVGFEVDHTKALLLIEEAEKKFPDQSDARELLRDCIDDWGLDYKALREVLRANDMRMTPQQINFVLTLVNEKD